jgi:hypothetical protein
MFMGITDVVRSCSGCTLAVCRLPAAGCAAKCCLLCAADDRVSDWGEAAVAHCRQADCARGSVEELVRRLLRERTACSPHPAHPSPQVVHKRF